MSRRRSLLSLLLIALLAIAGSTSFAHAQDAQEILNSFADEPSILQVQSAALIYAGLDPQMVSGWYTRANIAKLMPDRAEYRVDFRNDTREINRFNQDNGAPTLDANGVFLPGEVLGSELRDEQRSQDQTTHRVNVRWDFSELIFNPDILRVSREATRHVKVREDVLSSITKLYFERRRSQVELKLNPPSDVGERLRSDLQVQELTAEIDALTGGWFSSQLRAKGLNPY